MSLINPTSNTKLEQNRFTRLVDAFSKSLDHLKAAVAPYMAWYNFCRVRQNLARDTRDASWNLRAYFVCHGASWFRRSGKGGLMEMKQ